LKTKSLWDSFSTWIAPEYDFIPDRLTIMDSAHITPAPRYMIVTITHPIPFRDVKIAFSARDQHFLSDIIDQRPYFAPALVSALLAGSFSFFALMIYWGFALALCHMLIKRQR